MYVLSKHRRQVMGNYEVQVKTEKQWYESKTIWGTIASAMALVALAFGTFYGQDYMPIIETVGVILGIFGIPFTIYGRTKAGGIKKMEIYKIKKL
jgi:hypothetical protein